MHSKLDITRADLFSLGREDGEHISKVFEKTVEPHGAVIPENVVAGFLQWQSEQVSACTQRLTDAGLTPAEIGEWHRGVVQGIQKKRRAVACRHGEKALIQ